MRERQEHFDDEKRDANYTISCVSTLSLIETDRRLEAHLGPETSLVNLRITFCV